MNIVIFTQGISPIVEPILEKYGLQAVVESGPRGSTATTGNTKLQSFCSTHHIPYYWLTKPTRSGLIPFLSTLSQSQSSLSHPQSAESAQSAVSSSSVPSSPSPSPLRASAPLRDEGVPQSAESAQSAVSSSPIPASPSPSPLRASAPLREDSLNSELSTSNSEFGTLNLEPSTLNSPNPLRASAPLRETSFEHSNIRTFKHLDLAAVYSMSQLLPAEVLSLFPRGVINAHPSALPAYRGPNPYFWTFYDGCRETALTIHYLDPGEDTGDVILQAPIRLDDLPHHGLAVDLQGAVKRLLAPCMLRALAMIESGTAPRTPQPAESPTARARNITVDNVGEILSALRLPLDQAAVFFANTLGALPLRQFGFRRMSGDWRVSHVVPVSLEGNHLAVDQIRHTRYGFAIPRPDGWVVLKPGCGCIKFWLKLVRDALRAIRARKTNRPKIGYYTLDSSRCVTHNAEIDVRDVTDANIRDVAEWRGESTVQTFEGFLKQVRVGVYAYQAGKVVGHAWLWRAGEKNRRLFGWLRVPDGWDFVYYCRATEGSDYADIIRAMLAALSSSNLKGECLGISVPENDRTLNSVIKGLSKSAQSAQSAVKEGTAD